MIDSLPKWLKSIDHGKIGEARTKSLLIEYFWILERSVDIEGADFIIQRKLLGRNILDKKPPAFGYVQSKYFENTDTYINIKKEYIQGKNNDIYNEYFLIIHTGDCDHSEIYFLQSKDIIESFTEKEKIFRIRASKLMQIKKYKIQSKKYLLNTIDNKLIQADFDKNRKYFQSMYIFNTDIPPIDHDYTLPIKNRYGNHNEGIHKIKKDVLSLISDLKYDIKKLEESIDITDLIKFLQVFEFNDFEFLNNFFENNGDYFDEDLMSSLLVHQRRIEILKNDNSLNFFNEFKKNIYDKLHKDISETTKVSNYVLYSLKINFMDFNILELIKRELSIKEFNYNEKIHGYIRNFGCYYDNDDIQIYYLINQDNNKIEENLKILVDLIDEEILTIKYGEYEIN